MDDRSIFAVFPLGPGLPFHGPGRGLAVGIPARKRQPAFGPGPEPVRRFRPAGPVATLAGVRAGGDATPYLPGADGRGQSRRRARIPARTRRGPDDLRRARRRPGAVLVRAAAAPDAVPAGAGLPGAEPARACGIACHGGACRRSRGREAGDDASAADLGCAARDPGQRTGRRPAVRRLAGRQDRSGAGRLARRREPECAARPGRSRPAHVADAGGLAWRPAAAARADRARHRLEPETWRPDAAARGYPRQLAWAAGSRDDPAGERRRSTHGRWRRQYALAPRRAQHRCGRRGPVARRRCADRCAQQRGLQSAWPGLRGSELAPRAFPDRTRRETRAG